MTPAFESRSLRRRQLGSVPTNHALFNHGADEQK